MADSRIAARAPLRILCQHEHGGCAACCGVYNFRDRSAEAERARLVARTERVAAAWTAGTLPDEAALARARDELVALEAPDVLFAGVKVCPFAGYVEEGRVGCLLHPSRHPRAPNRLAPVAGLTVAAAGVVAPPSLGDNQARSARLASDDDGAPGSVRQPDRRSCGADLRDLGVYPREICAGHFCAPHDWLRAREADLAQTARGVFYGRVVTDAGLVKALARLLDDALGRAFRGEELTRAQPALDALWDLLRDWPWRDQDPARFGGFVFVGNEATEHSVPSCLAGLSLAVEPAARAVLDALGTRALDEREARAALGRLDAVVHAIADGLH